MCRCKYNFHHAPQHQMKKKNLIMLQDMQTLIYIACCWLLEYLCIKWRMDPIITVLVPFKSVQFHQNCGLKGEVDGCQKSNPCFSKATSCLSCQFIHITGLLSSHPLVSWHDAMPHQLTVSNIQLTCMLE